MSTLNVDVCANVNLAHIRLTLGLSKLAACSHIKQAADADEFGQGAADPAAIGAALAEAVLTGEAAAPIVDPELPRSFRWIRRPSPTRRPRRGAWSTAPCRAWRTSAPSWASSRSGTRKEAAENAAQGITTRAAALLLTALSGALLQLSGALPTAWPWLRLLLEAAAKVAHG